MSIGESFGDFTVHTVPAILLEDYLNGTAVMSAMTHSPIVRPPRHDLYAMHHEHLPLPGYIVRLIWRRAEQ